MAEPRAQLKPAEEEYRRAAEPAKRRIASQSDLDQAGANAKALREL